jgi:hypothetical protein
MPLALQSMSERRRCKISGERLALAAPVDQPRDNGQNNPNAQAQENTLERIAYRKAEQKPEEQEDGEKAAAGQRSSVRHRWRTGTCRAEAPASCREVELLY